MKSALCASRWSAVESSWGDFSTDTMGNFQPELTEEEVANFCLDNPEYLRAFFPSVSVRPDHQTPADPELGGTSNGKDLLPLATKTSRKQAQELGGKKHKVIEKEEPGGIRHEPELNS